MCRHPTGSRHFAAELAFYAPYCSYPTDAAACVGTLRAAATLLPSWILCSLLLLPDRCGSMCRHPTGSRHFAAELDFMLLIAPTRQVRQHVSAPYGQPPLCCRVGFYAPYCSCPTDAAAFVGTIRAAANLQPSWR